MTGLSPRIKTVTREAERRAAVPRWRRAIAWTLKVALPIALIAAGAAAAYVITSTGPVAERSERPRVPRLVTVLSAQPASQGPKITAWGEVVASRSLLLRPEVPGRVVERHPALKSGAIIPAGDMVLRIDDQDLRLALRRAEADIREIEARIAIERGQAQIGQRELNRLNRNLTAEQRALVLREPQMAQLEAELAAAEAEREQAQLMLDRALMTAPFDAIVLSEQVEVGTMLPQGSEAAELVAADSFSLSLAIPTASIGWVEPGATVELTKRGVWGSDATREGQIDRITPRLTETGRMAEIVVTIDDPLARQPRNQGKPQVLIGAFVSAEITGRALPGAVRLDRRYLRDGDTVWIATPDDTLEVRKVSIVWRGPEEVLIASGLAAGERIITSPLRTHADGMKIRLREDGA